MSFLLMLNKKISFSLLKSEYDLLFYSFLEKIRRKILSKKKKIKSAIVLKVLKTLNLKNVANGFLFLYIIHLNFLIRYTVLHTQQFSFISIISQKSCELRFSK